MEVKNSKTHFDLTKQSGGSHYKDLAIQPIEIIDANNLSFMEGSVLKYLLRWKAKNGIEDLKKAQQYLGFMISKEELKIKEPSWLKNEGDG